MQFARCRDRQSLGVSDSRFDRFAHFVDRSAGVEGKRRLIRIAIAGERDV